MRHWFGLALTLLLISAPPAARAEDVAAFYHSHQMQIASGSAVSESTSSYERALAQFMPRYIPGNPTIINQSMPGAGGVTAANYVASVAPADGTVIGSVHGFVPLMPLFGMPGPRFDPRKLHYLGSMYRSTGLCIAMKRDHIATLADMQKHEMLVGTSGPVTEVLTFYNTLKTMLGVKLKVVYGYASSAAINLALESGELQGRCGVSWSALLASEPNWARGEEINIIMQLRLEKDPELPNVPVLGDLVTKPSDRAALKVLLASPELGYPMFLAPGVPPDRVQALRRAFDLTMKNHDFQALLVRERLELSPTDGASIQSMIDDLYQTPPDVMARVRDLAVPRKAQ
jgi:tripartite-type tricarboxylate transporter receptor subunit TctC